MQDKVYGKKFYQQALTKAEDSSEAVTELIPSRLVFRLQCVPIEDDGERLRLATSDPLQLAELDEAKAPDEPAKQKHEELADAAAKQEEIDKLEATNKSQAKDIEKLQQETRDKDATIEELQIEHAIAREALRLAFVQHRELAVGLKGVQSERTLSDAFDQTATGESLIQMMQLDLLVGSGGVLSHAPSRNQAAALLIDAFQPEGITRLAVDSIFMMPHLGVLSTVNEQAATDVFERDCLIYLGTCVAPVHAEKTGGACATYEVALPGSTYQGELKSGGLHQLPLATGETADLTVRPTHDVDAGAGPGQELKIPVHGGVAGLIIDARGRPLQFADGASARNTIELINAIILSGVRKTVVACPIDRDEYDELLNELSSGTVSYTHLTLPTILLV